MSELPRRTIEELKTRYFCEPELYDIYVEGGFDNEIIRSWCVKNNDRLIVPYEINTVDIPFDILDKYNFTEGCKQRVIALAKELSQENLHGYRCLVDMDLDHWLGKVDEITNLIWTKYCSLELYYFKEDLIKRIVIEVSGSKIKDWDIFYSSFIDILKNLYCMRLVNESLNMNIEWIDLDKFISLEGNSLVFENVKYLQRVLMKNGLIARAHEFDSSFDMWFRQLIGDPRSYIRGHDFVKLISISNKKFKGIKNFHDNVAIERLFFAFVDEVKELIDSVKETM